MSGLLKVVVVAAVVLGANSLSAQEENKEFDSNFTHVVYFWFNNPDNAEDRQTFETSLKKFLKNSEYAQTKFIGVPAETPREVVDNSYTYSLILTFPSKEIQDKYQTEPAHKVFIEESSHLWKKVQVYDSVGIDKLAEK
ncbi:Dabb family protein [Salegentibacter sp. F188]|uniref:Dabb family protein n=1 Tax=Autumnicola patrickiae TaxID=3075591 RepID=A0ABU3DZD6_9FLAO|nr:Dabb family protein [Salegentibacter sp. F188]MDT0689020.1 Dabb family protein [Salegentibacter sp. F188]